jgi:hypothetical protein
MKVLIVNHDYPDFTGWLYRAHSGLESRVYEEQLQARLQSLFGLADFCSINLRKLGHEAWNIFFDSEQMQRAWAREHGLKLPQSHAWKFRLRRGIVPWVQRLPDERWAYDVLAAQIKRFKPDILLIQAVVLIDPLFLAEIKPLVKLLAGQIASPFSMRKEYGVYDLMVSSLPWMVQTFRDAGLRSELNRLAFEPSVLNSLGPSGANIDASFVGSLSYAFQERIAWLETVCANAPVTVWSPHVNGLRPESPIRSHHAGAVYGIEMFRILKSSSMTLNHHIDVAGPHANNQRLYEATGVGTLLVTDWKQNLHELFEPGKEVVVYRNSEECVELIRYYLDHGDERAAIARAGQQRTLRDHTFEIRMRELAEILMKELD